MPEWLVAILVVGALFSAPVLWGIAREKFDDNSKTAAAMDGVGRAFDTTIDLFLWARFILLVAVGLIGIFGMGGLKGVGGGVLVIAWAVYITFSRD